MNERNAKRAQPAADRAADIDRPPADDGVDVTLIRWMLSLSPRERLAVLQRNAECLVRLRNARSDI